MRRERERRLTDEGQDDKESCLLHGAGVGKPVQLDPYGPQDAQRLLSGLHPNEAEAFTAERSCLDLVDTVSHLFAVRSAFRMWLLLLYTPQWASPRCWFVLHKHTTFRF